MVSLNMCCSLGQGLIHKSFNKKEANNKSVLSFIKNVLKSSPLKPVSQYSKHIIDGP
jgi:hypothetical protein